MSVKRGSTVCGIVKDHAGRYQPFKLCLHVGKKNKATLSNAAQLTTSMSAHVKIKWELDAKGVQCTHCKGRVIALLFLLHVSLCVALVCTIVFTLMSTKISQAAEKCN